MSPLYPPEPITPIPGVGPMQGYIREQFLHFLHFYLHM